MTAILDKIYPMKKLHISYISIFLLTSCLVCYSQNYRQPAVSLDSIAMIRLANGFSVGFQPHPKGSSFLLQLSLSSYGSALTAEETVFLSAILDKPFKKTTVPIRKILEGLRIQTLSNQSGITLIGEHAHRDTAMTLLADAVSDAVYDSVRIATQAKSNPRQSSSYFEQPRAVLSHFSQQAIGKAEVGDSLTVDSVGFITFTKARLQPNYARLVCIGKGKADSVLYQKLDQTFGRWKVDTNLVKKNACQG